MLIQGQLATELAVAAIAFIRSSVSRGVEMLQQRYWCVETPVTSSAIMRHVQKSSQSLRYTRLKINERDSIGIEGQVYIYPALYG